MRAAAPGCGCTSGSPSSSIWSASCSCASTRRTRRSSTSAAVRYTTPTPTIQCTVCTLHFTRFDFAVRFRSLASLDSLYTPLSLSRVAPARDSFFSCLSHVIPSLISSCANGNGKWNMQMELSSPSRVEFYYHCNACACGSIAATLLAMIDSGARARASSALPSICLQHSFPCCTPIRVAHVRWNTSARTGKYECSIFSLFVCRSRAR